MNIQNLRSQFSIFIFLPELQMTSELKQTFVSSGYESFMFVDQDLLIDRVHQAAPHVILFSPDALVTPLSEFTEAVLGANPEVQLICVASAQEAAALYEYRDYNYALLLEPGPNLHLRAVWAVDQVCESLAYQYQNENLVEQLNEAKSQVAEAHIRSESLAAELEESRRKMTDSPRVLPLIQKFSNVSSKEELIDSFLARVGERKRNQNWTAVYFKYLPSVASFAATQGHQVNLERTKGVGAKLSSEEVAQLSQDLQSGKIPSSLKKVLLDAFQIQSWAAYPLFLGTQVEGLLVLWGTEFQSTDWEEFVLFQLCYQNIQLQKKLSFLDVKDPVTELYTKKFFDQKLQEEVARARRISRAVSVVKIRLDQAREIEEKYGAVQRDLVVRSIALLVQKTSRVNDCASRAAPDEIAMILPHSSRKGAALRAERLRRTIEGHSFSLSGLHVTVSLGVSEYPTLCTTAEKLESSASEALDAIASKGGNKVCLYQPDEDFKPDFEVTVV